MMTLFEKFVEGWVFHIGQLIKWNCVEKAENYEILRNRRDFSDCMFEDKKS